MFTFKDANPSTAPCAIAVKRILGESAIQDIHVVSMKVREPTRDGNVHERIASLTRIGKSTEIYVMERSCMSLASLCCAALYEMDPNMAQKVDTFPLPEEVKEMLLDDRRHHVCEVCLTRNVGVMQRINIAIRIEYGQWHYKGVPLEEVLQDETETKEKENQDTDDEWQAFLKALQQETKKEGSVMRIPNMTFHTDFQCCNSKPCRYGAAMQVGVGVTQRVHRALERKHVNLDASISTRIREIAKNTLHMTRVECYTRTRKYRNRGCAYSIRSVLACDTK